MWTLEANETSLLFLNFFCHVNPVIEHAVDQICIQSFDIYIYIYALFRDCILTVDFCLQLLLLLNIFIFFPVAGLSLKSQDLTALFLAVRLYCSFVMEYDIHTLLDSAALGTTLWVIYMMRFKLKSSYMEDKDNFSIYLVVRLLYSAFLL